KAVPTTDFTVTGDLVAPARFQLAALGSLPAMTETVTFQTGSGPQTGAFTGPTLWTLLNTVGLQTPAVKNGILRQYVIAAGSDGYTAAFSLGELAPQFGGRNPQVLVGYQQDGMPLGSPALPALSLQRTISAAAMCRTLQTSASGPLRRTHRKAADRQLNWLSPAACKIRALKHCLISNRCRQRPRTSPMSPAPPPYTRLLQW